MRMTLAIVSLLALAARAQDARMWRAYDIGASPVYRHVPVNEDRPTPPFGLLGLAPPSNAQQNENLWETGDNEPDGLAEIAPGILKSLIPGINFLGARDSLLIEGTAADHRLIARTIQLLRAQTLIAVEVRHLSLPGDLDPAGRRLIADALAGNIDAATLAGLRKLDESGGWSGGTIHALAGSWAPLEATRRVLYLPEFDVEIAQGSSVADPIPARATEGLRAAIRAFPLNDGRVLIRLMTSAGRLDPHMARFSLKARDLPDTLAIRDTNFGMVEQAEYRGCCTMTSFLARSGATQAFLLGSPDDRTDRQDLLLLTPRITRRATDETTLAMLPIGSLTNHAHRWRLALAAGGQPAWLSEKDASPRFADAKEALERLAERGEYTSVSESDYAGGALFVQAPKPMIQSMRELLASLEKTVLHQVRVEIDLVVVRDAKRTRIGAISQPTLVGGRTSFAAYRTLDYVADHDVEVAQEARIADPIHRIATAGVLGNAQVWRVGSGYRMALELSVSALEAPTTIEHGTGGVGALQRVPQTLRHSTFYLDFPDEKAREIDLGANPFGDRQGHLIAVVRCR